ncbi:MAG: hypothetical protein ACLPWG_01345 [Steroidobacteraceae bacterium]
MAAITRAQPPLSPEIERLAKAICAENDDPALVAQAQVIAANELVLRAVREQQIAVVERLREPTAIALTKGDNSLEIAKGRFMQSWLAHRDIVLLAPKAIEKYKEELPSPKRSLANVDDFDDDLVPLRLEALLKEPDSIEPDERTLALAREVIEKEERDELEALEEAAPDLVRLDRYERRAWSRQKRALRDFIDAKLRVMAQWKKAEEQ